MESLDINVEPSVAIRRIAEATGNTSLRFSAPLSGKVSGIRFRVTLPPGFNNPYRPVIEGAIVNAGSGSRIEYEIVRPWLGHAAVAVIVLVFVSTAWPNMLAIGIGILIAIVVVLGGLNIRTSETVELISRLKKAIDGIE